MNKSSKRSILLGAAFLMATSAIGPGFITQTTVFTQQLLASFGFVMLCSVLLDIVAQLNIWRVITVSGMRAQDLANQLLPGMGYLLAFLVAGGGLAFNIGNTAGAGLGMQTMFGMDVTTGAVISTVISLVIFWVKEAGIAMDWFARILGFVMIGLTLFIAISSHPPITEAIHRTFIPEQINGMAILTLVGGTVGGYISFAGAHRLLDAGIRGKEQVGVTSRGAITAILLASIMRVLLFLASLGVVITGVAIAKENPAASVFRLAAGEPGYRIFGVVLWGAAITSVVGSAYTSVSFVRSFHPLLEKNSRLITSLFIIISSFLFAWIGQPVKVLIVAGALNGLVLPVALALILLAAVQKRIVGTYRHPLWMLVSGWSVVALVSFMGVRMILALFSQGGFY